MLTLHLIVRALSLKQKIGAIFSANLKVRVNSFVREVSRGVMCVYRDFDGLHTHTDSGNIHTFIRAEWLRLGPKGS